MNKVYYTCICIGIVITQFHILHHGYGVQAQVFVFLQSIYKKIILPLACHEEFLLISRQENDQ